VDHLYRFTNDTSPALQKSNNGKIPAIGKTISSDRFWYVTVETDEITDVKHIRKTQGFLIKRGRDR